MIHLALVCRLANAPAFYPDSTSDQPFVCDYRKLAWEFAKKVRARPAGDSATARVIHPPRRSNRRTTTRSPSTR